MKKTITALLMLAFTQADAARDGVRRTRVTVRCVEVAAVTRTLYEAEIEGPDATDFDVTLSDRDFEMTATFVNERLDARTSDVRMSIAHRRRAGTSSNKLQLWEEGTQQQRVRVGADEQLELLPFGGAGPRGTLKFEIVREDATGDANAPVSIAIRKQESRAIRVRAYRVPHWYLVEATLRSHEGRELARGAARVFRGEMTRLAIGNVAELRVTPDPAPYQDAWRTTQLRFDGRWRDGTTLASGWEGVTSGAPLTYQLADGATLTLAARPEDSTK
jgi:hypothetical protein